MIKVSYENSLINLSASLLKHYNAFIEYKTLKVVDEYLNKGYNHVILMVLDGLGINIIKAHLDENDGLRKNIKHVANSVFPPTTVAATNAILSGKPSFVSGFVGWMQYNQFADAHEVVFFGYDYYDANKIVSPQLADIATFIVLLFISKKYFKVVHFALQFSLLYLPIQYISEANIAHIRTCLNISP